MLAEDLPAYGFRGTLRDDPRVGDGADGRRVDDQMVVRFGQLLEQRDEAAADEQLGRVVGLGAAGQDVQVFDVGVLDRRRRFGVVAGEQVGQAGGAGRKVEDLVLGRAAEVGVDQQDARAGLGHGDR